MAIMSKRKKLYKRILVSIAVFIAIAITFTVIVNIKVANTTESRIYGNVDSIPHNKVGLLLGTNPLYKSGRPNTYFTNRIRIAAELYHAGKIDYILASGDNHTRLYDEPSAMRDSLMAHGIPENRIILDFAGFRTLDSVVRAKEVFGCDSLTIISQADHCARALYIADANGIEAFAIAAPMRAGRWVRVRLAIREWLARDKMMLDLWLGKRPHFLGEKIEIPNVPVQKSYSANDGSTLTIDNRINSGPRVNISLFRLTDIEGGIAKISDGTLTFTATDAAGQPIGGRITFEGDTAHLTFTESSWEYLPKGTTYTFVRGAKVDYEPANPIGGRTYSGSGKGGGLATNVTIKFGKDGKCQCTSDFYQAFTSPVTVDGTYAISYDNVEVRCQPNGFDTPIVWNLEIMDDGQGLGFNLSDTSEEGSIGTDWLQLTVQ